MTDEELRSAPQIIERLGLDWLLFLLGKRQIFNATSSYLSSMDEVREKFRGLAGKEKVDDALEYCTELLEREDDRSEKVDSKAATLLGLSGLTSSFTVGFASLLLDQLKGTILGFLTAIIFVLLAISFFMTIYLASRVLAVGDYWYTYPSAHDIYKLSKSPLCDVKLERLASIFHSQIMNSRVVNKKATYLQGAQIWFRNSITILLIICVVIALFVIVFPVATTLPQITTSTPTVTGQPTLTPAGTSKPSSSPTFVLPVSPTEAPTIAIPSVAPSNNHLDVTPNP